MPTPLAVLQLARRYADARRPGAASRTGSEWVDRVVPVPDMQHAAGRVYDPDLAPGMRTAVGAVIDPGVVEEMGQRLRQPNLMQTEAGDLYEMMPPPPPSRLQPSPGFAAFLRNSYLPEMEGRRAGYYADGGMPFSQSQSLGTSNYVPLDPRMIEILRRYAMGGGDRALS